MNAGYNGTLSALSEASPTRASAAARGNPFADFTDESCDDAAARCRDTSTSPKRLLQLASAMDAERRRRNGTLADVSPTRANAAAKGNPFAMFGADSDRATPSTISSAPLSPVRLRQLNCGLNAGYNTKLVARSLSDASSARASAAALGNPFALFGTVQSHSRPASHTAQSGSGQAAASSRSNTVTSGQRLEASIVFEHSSNRAASAAVRRQPMPLQRSKLPRPQSAAAARVAPFPKQIAAAAAAKPFSASKETAGKREGPHVTSVNNVGDAAAATDVRTESVMLKKKPQPALRVSLPDSPSDDHAAAAVVAGDDDHASPRSAPAPKPSSPDHSDAVVASSSSPQLAREPPASLLGDADPSASCSTSITHSTSFTQLATTLDDLETQVARLSKLSK
jgi:hypothetical protein